MTPYLRQEIEKVLTAMAYRRMEHAKPIWGKPVGWQLYTVEVRENTLKWTNWFIGANKAVLIWESQEWDAHNGAEYHGTVLDWLKDAENYSGKMKHTGQRPNFEFMTREEQALTWLQATKRPPSLESLWGALDHSEQPTKKAPDPVQAGFERS